MYAFQEFDEYSQYRTSVFYFYVSFINDIWTVNIRWFSGFLYLIREVQLSSSVLYNDKQTTELIEHKSLG